MDHRPLGRTGLSLSPIGYGAFKIGRNQNIKYPAPYDLPSDGEVSRLLNGLLDLGINYIDTAPAYGLSEQRIGQALSHRRDEFVLSTKVGETFENGRSTYDFSADAVRRSVERSLLRMNTRQVEIVFIHSNGDDIRIMSETDVVPALMSLKQRGVTKLIGLSGKTVAGAAAALQWADVIMVEYHLDDRSHEAVMAAAAERGAGVVVKKALRSGTLEPAAALRFVLSNPAVGSAVVGGLNLDHIEANIAAITTQ